MFKMLNHAKKKANKVLKKSHRSFENKNFTPQSGNSIKISSTQIRIFTHLPFQMVFNIFNVTHVS